MPAGVCQYCKVTDDQVDGDRLRWHNPARTCCSKYACVKQHHAARIRAAKPRSRFAELIASGYGFGAACDQIRREERRRRRARRKDRAA